MGGCESEKRPISMFLLSSFRFGFFSRQGVRGSVRIEAAKRFGQRHLISREEGFGLTKTKLMKFTRKRS